MNQTTIQPITEILLNAPLNIAEAYYQSEFDQLTKQIYFEGEYWQLFVKNGIIVSEVNIKQS